MARRERLTQDELAYQVCTHLLYELKWLIFAADAFQRTEGGSYVAFLDSASIHARNLFEFAAKKDTTRFTLYALGGRAAKSDAWDRWVNNRVAHMFEREHDKAPWPEGREGWDRSDKLMRMAGAVLRRLRDGCVPIPRGPLRDAYEEVLSASEVYWISPTPQNHELLADLYDDSQDEPYPD